MRGNGSTEQVLKARPATRTRTRTSKRVSNSGGPRPTVRLVSFYRTRIPVLCFPDMHSEARAALECIFDLQSFNVGGNLAHGVRMDNVKPRFGRLKRSLLDPEMKSQLQNTYDFLVEYFKDELDSAAKNLKRNLVHFDNLWILFAEDSEVVFDDEGPLQGAFVVDSGYHLGWGSHYYLDVRIVVHDGSDLVESKKRIRIYAFDGVRDVRGLPVRVLDAELRARLSERGALVRKMLEGGTSYSQYEGEMMQRTWMGPRFHHATGRCMLDARTFQKMNPNYESSFHELEEHETPRNESVGTVGDSDWMISVWMLGFSFGSKLWGEFNVENLSPIQFNTHAYDQLVLPSRTLDGIEINVKGLIRSLVENGNLGFSDFISGKGGGIIFLLHGPPGVGKTLTAEAIADLLERPLYSISVGELGTSPDTLEEQLRTVLEVAVLWNAVPLIDEADIFLERRKTEDVERNALVSIFLRLLEYHQGVLFLTTNRVQEFDPAFHSRISVALHYPDHSKESRRQIWTNLLLAAKVDPSIIDLDRLEEININGRQIKHAVRIALATAASAHREVCFTDFLQVVKLQQQFNNDLQIETTSEGPVELRPVSAGRVSHA